MDLQHAKLNDKRLQQLMPQHCKQDGRAKHKKEGLKPTASLSVPRSTTVPYPQIHSLGLIYKKPQLDMSPPKKKVKQECTSSATRVFGDLECNEDLDSQVPRNSEEHTRMDIQKFDLFNDNISLGVLFQDKPMPAADLPKLVESSYSVDPHYLDRSTFLNGWWRAKLCVWLMVMGKDIALNPATVHLAIEFMDRFFAICKTSLSRTELQDYAITTLSLAAKQNEITAPRIKDLSRYTSATQHQLFEYEINILNTLKWKLHPITHYEQFHNVLMGLQVFCQVYQPQYQFLSYRIQNVWFEGFTSTAKSLKMRQDVVTKLQSQLELLICDAEHLIYAQKTICLGIVYVALGIELSHFETAALDEMSKSSRFLLGQNIYNSFFGTWIRHYQMDLSEILASVQYIASVLKLGSATQHHDFLLVLKSREIYLKYQTSNLN